MPSKLKRFVEAIKDVEDEATRRAFEILAEILEEQEHKIERAKENTDIFMEIK